MQEQRNMADLQAFLEDGLSSELLLQHQLQEMKEAHKQQLQETERRQREGLEKRIQQNSMLSADFDRKSSADRQLDKFFSSQARYVKSPNDANRLSQYICFVSLKYPIVLC